MRSHNEAKGSHEHHYRKFSIMIALSFVAIYVLMYSMGDRFESVHHNLNQVYMAGIMAIGTAPPRLHGSSLRHGYGSGFL